MLLSEIIPQNLIMMKTMMRIITIIEQKMGHFKSKVNIRFHATKSDYDKKNRY
jgi:hypothetical protein